MRGFPFQHLANSIFRTLIILRSFWIRTNVTLALTINSFFTPLGNGRNLKSSYSLPPCVSTLVSTFSCGKFSHLPKSTWERLNQFIWRKLNEKFFYKSEKGDAINSQLMSLYEEPFISKEMFGMLHDQNALFELHYLSSHSVPIKIFHINTKARKDWACTTPLPKTPNVVHANRMHLYIMKWSHR